MWKYDDEDSDDDGSGVANIAPTPVILYSFIRQKNRKTPRAPYYHNLSRQKVQKKSKFSFDSTAIRRGVLVETILDEI